MKKKGFTLIELLAVILILAIIAVIVTPIISKIIDEAKAQSDKRSAEKYIRAAQTFYMESQMDESKRNALGSNIINLLDLENVRATGTVIAYPNGTTEMAIVIGTRCFTKATTQDIIDIQMSKDIDNCHVIVSGVKVGSITSNDDSANILIDNSNDPGVTMVSCKFGTESGKYDTDGTINDNTCTLAPTVAGTRYYYKIEFSNGYIIYGTFQSNPGETYIPQDNTCTNCNSNNNNGGDNGGNNGGDNGGGNGGTNNPAVAAPVLTEANGQTVYTGRMVSPVLPIYFNVTTGTKCSNAEWTSNVGGTTWNIESGCLKFYAYMEDDLSYTMILDRNTDFGATWASSGTNSAGPLSALAQLRTDTDSWQGTITPSNYTNVFMANGATEVSYLIPYDTDGYKARLITTNEIARMTGNTSFNSVSTGSGGWFYLDGYALKETDPAWQTQVASSDPRSAFYWLFDFTRYSGQFGAYNESSGGPYFYWTSDAIAGTTNMAWLVTYEGKLGYTLYGNAATVTSSNFAPGIRPVISVLKSTLQ